MHGCGEGGLPICRSGLAREDGSAVNIDVARQTAFTVGAGLPAKAAVQSIVMSPDLPLSQASLLSSNKK